ncbi:toll-like receptor 2 type-2 [Ptychodera flava]|uniref:toll-like receptor 2 type-2 n=1 Tax=Ptychodera flava TaxID=63121 RepID=UPI00396A7DAD
MATAEIPVDETANTQRRGKADGDAMADYPQQATTFSNSGDSYNDSKSLSKSIGQAGTSGTEKQSGLVTDKGAADTDVTPTKCDVFFSYSSKDKDWVIQTAERLEKEYGIECSYDSKDFIGGKAITSNIMNCIKMSRKTVLVLSPDFLRSPWCGYEMQIVLREHLFREQKVVIPVLLHDCIIPDFISHLTYLEVQDPQFWEKFLEILKTDNTENESLQNCFHSVTKQARFDFKSIDSFTFAFSVHV